MAMMPPNNIIDELVRDEGFQSSAYQDPLGYWTIGSGICIDIRKGCGITADENSLLLTNRLKHVQSQLSEQFPWTDALDPIRLAVLWNMSYNMGVGGLSEFKNFLAAVQGGNWTEARDQMLDSVWAEQVGARAQRLALQIETGEWQ